MKDNKCPYLENGLYCTHKASKIGRKTKARRRCGYFSHEMCPLLKDSKSLLRKLVRALKIDSVDGVSQ